MGSPTPAAAAPRSPHTESALAAFTQDALKFRRRTFENHRVPHIYIFRPKQNPLRPLRPKMVGIIFGIREAPILAIQSDAHAAAAAPLGVGPGQRARG
jgi:hypothetical protein